MSYIEKRHISDCVDSLRDFLRKYNDVNYDVYLSRDLQYFLIDNDHAFHMDVDYWIGLTCVVTPERLDAISDRVYEKELHEKLESLETNIRYAICGELLD